MTSVTLANPPINVPVADPKTGMMTRPWVQWFAQALWLRVGQATAPSLGDNNDTMPPAADGEIVAALNGLAQALQSVPVSQVATPPDAIGFAPSLVPVVADPYNDLQLAALTAEVAALRCRVDGLEAGTLL